ncbi:hypothetical protein A3J36_02890 [Candidatus Uhrbacteria bacterium RIFCSPLOWO2_02_FULL_54_37]|uniref:Uncharacterized protein n=1 Tax=Candidatus Uhrbacteria bacterium RIFCSPLOWO2_02_FULL_54_37 TaxID=1802412 RepID=A0A1F7VJ20_9BACT|nr:MAG: hypothetical protein A3J36_02890 [Candidatus Uhrbacteria bacterium RIFCSPLOWO2_02_FULL_54_37]
MTEEIIGKYGLQQVSELALGVGVEFILAQRVGKKETIQGKVLYLSCLLIRVVEQLVEKECWKVECQDFEGIKIGYIFKNTVNPNEIFSLHSDSSIGSFEIQYPYQDCILAPIKKNNAGTISLPRLTNQGDS